MISTCRSWLLAATPKRTTTIQVYTPVYLRCSLFHSSSMTRTKSDAECPSCLTVSDVLFYDSSSLQLTSQPIHAPPSITQVLLVDPLPAVLSITMVQDFVTLVCSVRATFSSNKPLASFPRWFAFFAFCPSSFFAFLPCMHCPTPEPHQSSFVASTQRRVSLTSPIFPGNGDSKLRHASTAYHCAGSRCFTKHSSWAFPTHSKEPCLQVTPKGSELFKLHVRSGTRVMAICDR